MMDFDKSLLALISSGITILIFLFTMIFNLHGRMKLLRNEKISLYKDISSALQSFGKNTETLKLLEKKVEEESLMYVTKTNNIQDAKMMLIIMNRNPELTRRDEYELRRYLDCIYILRKSESPLATKNKLILSKSKFIEKTLLGFSINLLQLLIMGVVLYALMRVIFLKIIAASIILSFSFVVTYISFIKSLTKHPPLFTYKPNKKRVESLL
ncbi:hypothetical protein F3J37_21440 [Pantoea sp. Al-1710]|uniref:Uncharacterized protein n=2 Tax=Candidatus Pantoea communis TaxID=2608354 RepID=A0ABX0RVY1_9GAMM|nr:hypothetical protein [Pantoea communis]